MRGLKQTVFTAVATAALVCLPITPAAAAGPLLFAPWALGHIIGVGLRLATLPLAIASAAGAVQQPPYGPATGYDGRPDGNYAPVNYYSRPPTYYAPPNYYSRPPTYYAPPPAYYARRPAYYPAPQPYYRPAFAYARRMAGSYVQPRSYYASPGGFAYRRR